MNNEIIYVGTPSDALLDTQVGFALGKSKDDKAWRTGGLTMRKFIDQLLSEHLVGMKDGAAITQGPLVAPSRTAKNVHSNYIMMLDVDNGTALQDIVDGLVENGLFAVVWTTHSHGKSETLIPEKTLLTWMRKNKRTWEPDHEDIRDYFRDETKMSGEIARTCAITEKAHLEGGVKYRVSHAPIDRCRVLLLLNTPFIFSTPNSSQDERIKEWKRKYKAFSDAIGVSADESCTDPSRLMYLPRCNAADKINAHIYVIAGDPLDLDLVGSGDGVEDDEVRGIEASGLAASGGDDERRTFKTPGLLKFLKDHAEKFEAANFMKEYEEDGERRVVTNGLEFRCPNADNHSDGDHGNDYGFMVKNGEDNDVGSGFYMGCQHATCKAASGGDRAWFLDAFCQKHDLSLAQLQLFAPDYVKEQEKAAANVTSGDTLRDRIMKAETQEDREKLLKEMARLSFDDAVAHKIAMLVADAEVRRKLGAPAIAAFKELFANFKRTVRSESGGTEGEALGVAQVAPVPNDPSKATAIWREWTHDDKVRVLKAVFRKWNLKHERVFLNKLDEPVRVVISDDGVQFKRMTADTWTAVLTECVKYKLIDRTTGSEREVAPFGELVTIFNGEPTALGLPRVEGVTQVPVFGADGTLVTKNGYDVANRVFINCPFDIKDVSSVPSTEEIDEAVKLLFEEALWDFPFSDRFDGGDVEPLYVSNDDGTRIPNWGRGYVSRLHTLMLILQPFVRSLIKGNTPAYHLDKAVRGTGATYLANVPSIILTGEEATSHSLPDEAKRGGDETRKKITTVLLQGAPMIFWDNVNHKVDSADLARVLTAGKWSDRMLGGNDSGEFKVTSTWLFAGNNITFSDEMYRRLVPIRLDASRADPEKRDSKLWRHHPLSQWLQDNRRELVWACHTLVQNWIAQECPPGAGNLASYEAWAETMTGVLEAAGLTEALSTLDDYRDVSNDDAGEENGFIKWWWERWGEATVTTGELVEKLTGFDQGLSGGASPMLSALGVDTRNEAATMRSLGHFIGKHVVGKTFQVSEKITVKAVKQGKAPARYSLSLVKDRT